MRNQIVALVGPGNRPQMDDGDHAPVETPAPVAGVNGQRLSLLEGGETDQSPLFLVFRSNQRSHGGLQWAKT